MFVFILVFRFQAIAIGLEAIATRVEAIAAIAIRLEAIALRLEAIDIRSQVSWPQCFILVFSFRSLWLRFVHPRSGLNTHWTHLMIGSLATGWSRAGLGAAVRGATAGRCA